jgi:hypothetical protein
MQAINIDFASARVRPLDRLLLILLCVGILGGLMGLALGLRAAQQADEQRGAAQRVQVRQTDSSEHAWQALQVAPDVASAVNSTVDMLNYPLMDIFKILEKHSRKRVSVISVELGPVRSSLRMVVQASSALDVLDYLDEMKIEPGFRNIALTRQESAGGDGPGMNWRFTLEVPQTANLAQVVNDVGGER